MSWLERIRNQQQLRRDQDLWRTRNRLESAPGPEVVVDGQSFVNFSSNDYLGLACHPELIHAGARAMETYGTGSGASHLICGHHKIHEALERELAEFVGAEKALLFTSGFAANLAVSQALLQTNDYAFHDRLNHASLIDGALASKAKLIRYPHLDVEQLARRMRKKSDSTTSQMMIATDGVFSMDGDQAPIADLYSLAMEIGALLYVDEAHAIGVVGPSGRGTLSAAGCTPTGNVLMMGTLGKALGTQGAFVAGDAILIEQLIQFGRSYIYTTALPPIAAAIASAALRLLTQRPEINRQLTENVDYFRSQIKQHPAVVQRLIPSATAIQALILGPEKPAMLASQHLKSKGILAVAIRPPTVPANESRLRITLTAKHSRGHIDQLIAALTDPEMLEILESESST